MTKKIVLILVTLSILCFSVLCAPKLRAFSLFPNCNDPNAASSSLCSVDIKKGNNNGTHNVVLRDIKEATYVISYLAGAIAVLMIIVGGFTIVTAGGSPVGQRSGDSNKVKTAQARIVNSLIGLVIIALADVIVTFIINRV